MPNSPLTAEVQKRLAAQVELIPTKERKKSRDAQALESVMEVAGFPEWLPEFYFAKPKRSWRFDYAWPDQMIAVELEGGIWTGHSGRPCPVCKQRPSRPGRHNSPAGFLGDLEKYNVAALLGWVVVRVTDREITNGRALIYIDRAFQLRKDQGSRDGSRRVAD